jgi:hypothetical protein
VRLKDIIRAGKTDIKVGSWYAGKVPRAEFPIAKKAYGLGSSFKWCVIRFEALAAECRVLVVLNEAKQKYEAVLGVMVRTGHLGFSVRMNIMQQSQGGTATQPTMMPQRSRMVLCAALGSNEFLAQEKLIEPTNTRFYRRRKKSNSLRNGSLQDRPKRTSHMKEELCRAFCNEITVRNVPVGLAISTAFRRSDGDAIGFYVVCNPMMSGLAHLEDDGQTRPYLEAAGVDFETHTRAKAFATILISP